jgi:hypothetical protein
MRSAYLAVVLFAMRIRSTCPDSSSWPENSCQLISLPWLASPFDEESIVATITSNPVPYNKFDEISGLLPSPGLPPPPPPLPPPEFFVPLEAFDAVCNNRGVRFQLSKFAFTNAAAGGSYSTLIFFFILLYSSY